MDPRGVPLFNREKGAARETEPPEAQPSPSVRSSQHIATIPWEGQGCVLDASPQSYPVVAMGGYHA